MTETDEKSDLMEKDNKMERSWLLGELTIEGSMVSHSKVGVQRLRHFS